MAKMITDGASGNLFVCVSSQQAFVDKQLQVSGGGKQNFSPWSTLKNRALIVSAMVSLIWALGHIWGFRGDILWYKLILELSGDP